LSTASRKETERLVAAARERKSEYMKVIASGKTATIISAAHAYHDAFDDLKAHTRWSLSKLFDVVNEGQDF
jgi:hypothetical protein